MTLTSKLPSFSSDVFVAEIDGNKARTLRGFYPRVAKGLFFPDYFGKNLDALFDCLCSLEGLGKQDVVLLIKNAESFLEKEKTEKREAAFNVLRDAEKTENRSDGVKFRVIGVRE